MPTYRAMGDHTECFQVDFDPSVVSYEQLLDLFWASHDATRPALKAQYASLILASDEAQLVAAEQSARSMEDLYGRRVATRIEPLKTFWLAEGYHQKYYLRSDRVLLSEMRAYYPEGEEFVESTAAMRINALLAVGTQERVAKELPRLGLSAIGEAHLHARAR